MSGNTPQLMKDSKKNSRGSENPKEYNYKEKCTQAHHSKTSENQKSRRNFEGSQKLHKNITYRRTNLQIIADLTSESLQARRQWSDSLKHWKTDFTTIPPGHLNFGRW